MAEKLTCYDSCFFEKFGIRPCTINVTHSHLGNGCKERIQRIIDWEYPHSVSVFPRPGNKFSNETIAVKEGRLVATIKNGMITKYKNSSRVKNRS